MLISSPVSQGLSIFLLAVGTQILMLFLFNTFIFPLISSVPLVIFLSFSIPAVIAALSSVAFWLLSKLTSFNNFFRKMESFFMQKQYVVGDEKRKVSSHINRFDGNTYSYLVTEDFEPLKDLPSFVTEIVFQRTPDPVSRGGGRRFSEKQLTELIAVLPDYITHIHLEQADLSVYSSIHEQAAIKLLIKEDALPVSVIPHDVLEEYVLGFTLNLHSDSAVPDRQQTCVSMDGSSVHSSLMNAKGNQEGEQSRHLTFFTITNASRSSVIERVPRMQAEVLTEVTPDTQMILACRYR